MKVVTVRLMDQGAWSAAFFLANIWTAFSLSVDSFAASTIASSAGVVGAAVARAYAVDSRLISRTRDGSSTLDWFSSRISFKASMVAAVSSSAFVMAWYAIAGEFSQYWTFSLIAFLIVMADIPHYSLIIRGEQAKAFSAAFAYSLFIGIGWWVAKGHPVETWCIALVAVTIIGWILVGNRKSNMASKTVVGTSMRMSAESLYSAIASQLGILILYVVAASSATAGIRLTYSLVFAPVFMIIQGLFPLVLRKVTEVRPVVQPSTKSLLTIWTLACAAGLATFAGGAWLIGESGLKIAPTISLTAPFLLPVGASMLGSLVLDTGLLRWRLTVPPSKPHRLRLILTMIDLSLQVTLVLLFGLTGVIWGLTISGCLKLLVGLVLIIRNDEDLDLREGSSLVEERT